MAYISPRPPEAQPPDRKRPLFALGVLVFGGLALAILGLSLVGIPYLLGLQNDKLVEPPMRATPTTLVQAQVTTTVATQAHIISTTETYIQPTLQHAGGLNGPEIPTATPTNTDTPTPLIPTNIPTPALLSPTPATNELPAPSLTPTFSEPTPAAPAERSLFILQHTNVPPRDLYSIAARIKFKSNEPIPRTTDRPPGDYKIGHTDTFFISDLPNKRYYTITATVREVTSHAYWYAQSGRPVDIEALKSVAHTFDSQIYSTDHRLFGSEWTPGVDNDPRITVLFASIPGAGGYFSSADEATRRINPFSNEREIIYINSDGGLEGVESTLAHEFQHMIHWHQQANHDVWINEGASVLASAINGYEVAGVDGDFMREPDTQLNAWQPDPQSARANYGAAFLFLDFLRAHYGGDDIIREVVAAPGQGTEVIDNALTSLGRKERFTDVFERWVLANLLDGAPGAQAQGLTYPDREVSVSPGERLASYPAEHDGTVSQFGADYIELAPPTDGGGKKLQVDFTGQAETQVIAAPAHSGTGIWWSNRGDLADSTMTRAFDLRALKSATLDFYTWLDTESELDYGYVEASTDGGATWDTLKGKYTTATNPNGTNFGNGYTGKSAGRAGADANGWLHEQIGLGQYAGKETLIRFEYITDDGYNAGGIAVDDVSIPELGYKDDAEADNGWQSAGFVRLANAMPQHYYVALVKFKDSGGFEVQPVDVSEEGKASFTVEGAYSKAVLVIAGTTPHNIQKAAYQLKVGVGK